MNIVGRLPDAIRPTSTGAEATAGKPRTGDGAFHSLLGRMQSLMEERRTPSGRDAAGDATANGRDSLTRDGVEPLPRASGGHRALIAVAQTAPDDDLPAPDSAATAPTPAVPPAAITSAAASNDVAPPDVPDVDAGLITGGTERPKATAVPKPDGISLAPVSDTPAAADASPPTDRRLVPGPAPQGSGERTDPAAMAPSTVQAAAIAKATVLGTETHFAPMRAPYGGDKRGDTTEEHPDSEDAIRPPEASRRKAAGSTQHSAIDSIAKRDQGTLHATPPPAGDAGAPSAPSAPATGTGGLSAPVLHRLAASIASAAATASASPPPPVVTTPAAAGVAAVGPVRVLTLRLDLAGHGGLDVRMSTNGSALTLRLRTDTEETAHRLRRDRDELSSLLRGAGYDTDIAAIESRRVDAPSLPSAGQPPSGNAPGFASGGSGGAPSNQPRQHQGGEAFPAPERNGDGHETTRSPDRGAGHLYV